MRSLKPPRLLPHVTQVALRRRSDGRLNVFVRGERAKIGRGPRMSRIQETGSAVEFVGAHRGGEIGMDGVEHAPDDGRVEPAALRFPPEGVSSDDESLVGEDGDG